MLRCIQIVTTYQNFFHNSDLYRSYGCYMTTLNIDIFSSYDEIFKWWKRKTITYFNQLNQITCFMEINNIKSLNKIKDILNSISHVDRIYLESLNSEDIKLKIFYYCKMQEIINIFDLSNISIIEQNNKCIIKNESI